MTFHTFGTFLCELIARFFILSNIISSFSTHGTGLTTSASGTSHTCAAEYKWWVKCIIKYFRTLLEYLHREHFSGFGNIGTCGSSLISSGEYSILIRLFSFFGCNKGFWAPFSYKNNETQFNSTLISLQFLQ